GHGKREYAALPFCVKGRLAHFRYDWTKSVTSTHVMRAIHRDPPSGNVGRPVPIMQSRVTIDARRSSLHPSGPSGRIGRTRYRTPEGDSHTRICLTEESSTPKSRTTPRGSTTARER